MTAWLYHIPICTDKFWHAFAIPGRVSSIFAAERNRSGKRCGLLRYDGVVDAFRCIIREEGVMALWSGNVIWAKCESEIARAPRLVLRVLDYDNMVLFVEKPRDLQV